MTASERAADNAKKLAATVLPQLQREHDEIVARLAAAGPERAQLERQLGERLAHLKARLPKVPSDEMPPSTSSGPPAPQSPQPGDPPAPGPG